MKTRSRRFRAAVASTVSLCVAAGAALGLCWALDGAFAVRAAPSGELHVCPAGPPTCDYSTIQGAVDAALSSDVIKVAAGAYTDIHARDGITQVVYISKTVTVQGGYTTTNWTTPDPVAQVTMLDAQGLGRVMVITGSIAPTIEGLHLTGGDAAGLGSAYYEDDAGGGLYVQKATATITGNTFYANSSGGIGGAIALYDSPSQITGNTITSNTTVGDGGGVFLVYSDATLRGNTITDNDAATRDGGGVFVFYSSAMLRDNTISRNWARNSGGGVGLYQSPATLERNTVTHNTSASAGGLNLYLSDATLSGNVVAGNEAGNQGGAMQLHAGTVVLINNVISHNGIVDEPWRTGAGILVWDADCHLSHNTISGNHGGDGTGIHVMDSGFWFTFSTVEMTNTIVSSHTVGVLVTEGNTATLNATLWHANGTRSTGNAVRTRDVYGDPAFEADGYHLTVGSAAIERGVDAGVLVDIDGEVRPQGATFDIGADELPIPAPDVEWGKWVSLNSGTLLPWDEGPFTVVPGDKVNIAERVRVSTTFNTAFSLVDSWSSSLAWQGSDASVGTVTTSGLTATWTVTGAQPNAWHTLTKTFTVLADPGYTDELLETLTVQGAVYQPPPRVIAFHHQRPHPDWQKVVQINDGAPRQWDAGPFVVEPGDRMTVTDRLSITHWSGVSFTVGHAWGPRLELVDSTSDDGAVVPGAGSLQWQGVGVAANQWHTLTTVFDVLGPPGARESLTQTLQVADAASQLPPRVAELLISGPSGSCAARVNDGPTTYGTVQEAVDAAQAGDLVKVAGYCTGVGLHGDLVQVVYLSKPLTVRGGYTTTHWTAPDPVANPTTLDAQGLGRGMVISGSISPTVEGLRITGGKSDGLGGSPFDTDAGGGMLIQGASAVISGNVFYGNSSAFLGGGLFAHGGASRLLGNSITGNTAQGDGGGIYLSYSMAKIEGNTIHGNHATAFGSGGGIALHHSPATLTGNAITGNSAGNGGGGVAINHSEAVLEKNTLSDNTTPSSGGGIRLYSSDAALWGNLVTHNSANAHGGGIYLDSGAPTLVNNVVADNTLPTEPNWVGAGIHVRYASPRMIHNTIARNTGGDGSAVYVTDADLSLWTSDAALTNTIISGHEVAVFVTQGSTVTLEGTLWHANGMDSAGTGSIYTGTVNVHGDPGFRSDGYHLSASSAAIDAGVLGGVTTDIDGDERPCGAGYDIGADEAGPAAVFLPLVRMRHGSSH